MTAGTPDVELEQLVGQLLRVIGPALAAGRGPGDGRAGAAAAARRPGGGGGQTGRAAADRGNDAGPAGAHRAAASHDTAAAGPVPPGPRRLPAVSASEARALLELLGARGIAQGELAALLGLEKSTVSRLAAGLERKGWVRRGRDADNQRLIRLYLTAEGRALAGRLWRAWQSRQERILAELSAEERAGLAAGLRGLVRGLAAEGLLSGGTRS